MYESYLGQGQVVLLADGRESPAPARVIAMNQRKGLRMTGKQLQGLRLKHDLTQLQIAQLVHLKVVMRPSGNQSNQVGNWESGRKPIPPATAELLRAKLYLLEHGLATFELLIQFSLDELMRDIYS